ncbi:hypothetical protein BJ138DRAFT_935604 [Hygrophoropsis aurantiaca]|uniref:Uncharacterized protein n=1 Tax=Hygrophoropsis aurantiaca TaxID=72124 RepID=A0ACB8ADU8_9AGAM|nr:hypothetical protein BJ138DRAFT_935604 [Hygrophoropsis aurantiaca]
MSSPNQPTEYLYNIGAGPLVIGYSLSFGLMGFLTLQMYIYFKRFSMDPKGLRAFVWVLFITELLISSFTLHGFWIGAQSYSLLDIIGMADSAENPPPLWSLQALACLTGFVSFITHGFFCWRIWCLKRSCLIPIFVMMISLLQFSMVAYGGIMYSLCPTLTVGTASSTNDPAFSIINTRSNFEFFIPIWLGGSLMCDTIITVYMTIILRQERAKSSFQPRHYAGCRDRTDTGDRPERNCLAFRNFLCNFEAEKFQRGRPLDIPEQFPSKH